MDRHVAFATEIRALLNILSRKDDLEASARYHAEQILNRVWDMVGDQDPTLDEIGGYPSYQENVKHLLADFHSLMARGTSSQILRWAREMNEQLRRQFQQYQAFVQNSVRDPSVAEATLDYTRRIVDELEQENRMAAAAESADQFVASAEEASRLAQSAAQLAQSAAGVSGEASLSLHFAEYAKRELRTAEVFRILTALAIAAAVVLAIFLPHPNMSDVQGLITKVAQVSGVAALGTYFGRQAGLHRRVGNWAKGLQVQLQSFAAFITPVEDDATRNHIYQAFALRVLGAPPENTKRDSTSADPALIELLSLLVKRDSAASQ